MRRVWLRQSEAAVARSPAPLLESLRHHSVPYHFFPNPRSQSSIAFISGWACPARATWEPLLPHLAKSHSLILLEKRGHGMAKTANSIAASYFDDLAYDLCSALDHAHFDNTALVVHSMGGFVARNFYRLFPRRVSAIVFLCSPFSNPLDSWVFGNGPIAIAAVTGIQRILDLMPVDAVKSHAGIVRALVKLAISGRIMHPNGTMSGAFDNFYNELMGVPFSTIRLQLQAMLLEREVVQHYPVPTLYIGGSIDPLVRMEKVSKSGIDQTVVLQGIGHLPQLECPERLGEIIGGFLAANKSLHL